MSRATSAGITILVAVGITSLISTAHAAVSVSGSAASVSGGKRFTYTVTTGDSDTVKDFHIHVAHVDVNGNLEWGDITAGNYSNFDGPDGWSSGLEVRNNADGSKDYFVSYWGATELGTGNTLFRFDHSGNAEQDNARVLVTNDGNKLPGANDVVGSFSEPGPYAAVSGVPALGDLARILAALGLVGGAWFLMRRGG